MSYCASCGTAIPNGGTFCGQCGHRVGNPLPADPTPAETTALPPTVAHGPTPTPPPPPSQRNRALPIIVVLALAAVGAGIIVLATRKSDSPAGPDTGVTTTLVGGSSTVADTGGSTTAPATTAPADPATQLQQMALADKPKADALVGKVVVQLSAKKVGLTVGGITYGPAEILGDHLKLRDAFGAILVDAGAYQFSSGGQPMTGWYLTIVATPFPNKAAADQWCTEHGFSASDCFSRTFKPPK